MKAGRRAVWGWAIYDWANSAFATTVMAGFFPILFEEYWTGNADATVTTAQLGLANSVSGLMLALLAPILGAIADCGSRKKKFLVLFAYLGVLMTAGLFWVGQGRWVQATILYVAGSLGFAGANIFYDSLLPGLVEDDKFDRTSGMGFALGYLGGGLLFALNVCMALNPHFFGLTNAIHAMRVAMILVALWWSVFTLFLICWVPEERQSVEAGLTGDSVRAGFSRVATTFRAFRRYRAAWLFLLAYWFYIDGVDTVIKMASKYGLALGLNSKDLIIALLLVQMIGFPAALLYGMAGQRWGARIGLYVGLVVYVVIVLWGTTITTRWELYLLAGMIGLVQGGVQALSRSYYSRLIPVDRSAEFFGFYNMMGKFATIVGPLLMGGVGLLVKRILAERSASNVELASRCGFGSIAILFIIGCALLRLSSGEARAAVSAKGSV